MVHRPPQFPLFEFVVLAGLRAVQLTQGSMPRVEGTHKHIMTAQMEIATGKVLRGEDSPPD